MSRNASGTYTLPAGNPVVTGTLIESSWANTTLSDLASAMTDSLSRSGQGGMTAALRVVDGTVGAPGLSFANETGSGMYRSAAGDYSFAVLGSQKIRCRSTGVDVTGALGVTGYIGVNAASPYCPIDVGGNAAQNVQALFTTGVDDLNFRIGFLNGVAGSTGALQGNVGLYYLGTGEAASIGFLRGGSTTDGAIALRTNGNEKARVSATGGFSVGTTADPGAGAIYATGNITAYYSDERLKTKLGNLEGALDKICAIDTFYYEANETAQALGYKAEREVGVSAQSVQAVFPELVAPAPIDEQYLTVRYERLVAPIIEAIKELRAEVNALKGE
jgi:hypothetical protein